MNNNYRVNGNASVMIDSAQIQLEKPTFRQLKRILLDTIHSGWYMRVKHKDILVGDTYIAYSWSDEYVKTTVTVNAIQEMPICTALPYRRVFMVVASTTMASLNT